jgi:hypothetical protein
MEKKLIRQIQTIFLVAIIFVTYSCNPRAKTEANPPIVTVGNITLTLNDLKKAVPDNLHNEDSIAVVDDYIARWIKTQLTLRKAELNLTADEKNVEQQLQAYRTSLLVYLYQQKMLEQKHSPLVRSSEIEKYYNEMVDNFKLQENIVKGLFIKIPIGSPNQNVVKQLYRSTKPEDFLNLEAYCFQNARQFEVFEEWTSFNNINNYLPEPVRNEDSFLAWTKFYETSDLEYNYYVNIQEYMKMGQTAPLSYVEGRIRAILLNKKRMEFIQKLEQDLYDEAVRDEVLKFHQLLQN